jgi:3-phenylpropionate/trans-cinnamate dioxygenase alpha subunit
MCTYHGWTYATDGKLVGVPGYKEAYFEELDRSQWGLVEAGQIDNYKGLIFATWDKNAPSLLDYLGDITWYIDLSLDRNKGRSELLRGVQKHVMAGNWKIPSDNISGDGYHFPTTHGATVAVQKFRQGGRGFNGTPFTYNVYAGNGHCVMGRYAGPDRDVSIELGRYSPVVQDYFLQGVKELKQRLGETRARQMMNGVGNIFPYTGLHGLSPALRLRIPRGPFRTEEWTYCLVDKDAPAEVKDSLRRNHTVGFGPAGIVEMDDGNNWDQVTKSGELWRGKKDPMSFQLGLGRDVGKSEVIPGILSPSTGEANQRAFYGFWAEMMDAPSWAGIKIDPRTKV